MNPIHFENNENGFRRNKSEIFCFDKKENDGKIYIEK